MKKIILTLSVVTITVIGIYFSNSTNNKIQPDNKVENQKSLFNFNTNNKSHYRVKYRTVFDNTNSAYKIKSNISVDMDLDVRVFQKDTNGIYVGFQFSDLNTSFDNDYMEKKLNNLYAIFFIIKMNREGKFLQYYFPRKIKNIQGLVNILSLFQNILKDKPLYSCEEFDANGGVYTTTYRLQKRSLYKTREEYFSQKQSNIETIIQESHFKIEIDRDGNWIKNLNATERLLTKEDGVTILKNRNTLVVKKLATAINPKLQIWSEKRSIQELIKSLSQQQSQDKFSWKREEEKSLKKIFKANHITLRRLLQKVRREGTLSSRNTLLKYLQLNRQEIDRLYDIIVKSNDKTASILINLLELLNKPESQALLVKLVDDDNLSPDNQIRSAIALGTQKNLSSELIDDLWSIQSNHDNEEDKTRSDTILLALGSISSHTNQISSQSIDQQLKDLLYDESSDKIALLYSMQNSGIEKFQPEVINLVKTTKDIKIKVVSINVLKDAKGDNVKSLLSNEIKSASSHLVKASAIKALSNFKTDENIVKYIQNEIENVSDTDTKIAMVYYLIKSFKSNPENKKYLMDALHDIQDSRTKKAIIKTIIRNVK